MWGKGTGPGGCGERVRRRGHAERWDNNTRRLPYVCYVRMCVCSQHEAWTRLAWPRMTCTQAYRLGVTGQQPACPCPCCPATPNSQHSRGLPTLAHSAGQEHWFLHTPHLALVTPVCMIYSICPGGAVNTSTGKCCKHVQPRVSMPSRIAESVNTQVRLNTHTMCPEGEDCARCVHARL